MKCPICKHEVTINKIAENGGMDGRYYNWEITCNHCHFLHKQYPADNFYGREYYESADATLEQFKIDCDKILNEGKYDC